VAECDRIHQEQVNRERCYAQVQGGRDYRDDRRYDDRRYSRRAGPTSKAECDQLHQQQANREQCYEEVRRYGEAGISGSSSEPRRWARERERALDECAANYPRGSRSRDRCFDDVERRYGR
jgi:hypothetical protein